MEAFNLDRPIVIQQLTTGQGSAGGVTETWSEFASVLAEYVPAGGLEYFAAQQVNAQFDAKFRIRWISGVVPTMRIVYDQQNWDILAVGEIGRRDGIEIKARVRQA